MGKLTRHWANIFPVAGSLLAILLFVWTPPTLLAALVLAGAVAAAVHHAELIAHRVGEPFGTLILAVAVTVIEVGLILSLMLSAPDGGASALARDTVFAAVMIILNGLLGLCLLFGGLSHREQSFQQSGVSATLAALSALTVLALVLPNYTTSEPGPVYSSAQLAFVGVVSLLLYGTFVLVQTVRHRDYFLPEGDALDDADAHAPTPSGRRAAASLAMLVLALISVVVLAKGIAPEIEAAVAAARWPHAIVGVVIAAVVLAPESIAAVRAARANRLQTSLNLALGSAMATIGLTIPAVAAISIIFALPVALGLSAKSIVLLVLTLLVSSLSLATGKTTVLQGVTHLILFAVFLFLTIVP
ncbi:ionic transporter y4hA [Sphingomonas lacunae]|uniref:Ionic transporter y4hA n=1 Tax=Sphingomonas lacunae TaxID=2698828 RepID=A0A6M4AQ94_9SPHN|nr:ionic transporter y4hA [Sphingomonas lacunae]QJQ31198.1 ionic transporter y4hA [Sphingomonas lacunae]